MMFSNNFALSMDFDYGLHLSPALLSTIRGLDGTYGICDIRYEGSVGVLLALEHYGNLPLHVFLPHPDGHFNFGSPTMLKGDTVVCHSFVGDYRHGGFNSQLALVNGGVPPPGFPRAAIGADGYLNSTHVSHDYSVVQHATSNIFKGKVEAVRRTSIDVSGGELAIISRVERSLVLGGVRNLAPNDSVWLHTSMVPHGTPYSRRLIYTRTSIWETGLPRTIACRTPVVNWAEPTERTRQLQQERGLLGQNFVCRRY